MISIRQLCTTGVLVCFFTPVFSYVPNVAALNELSIYPTTCPSKDIFIGERIPIRFIISNEGDRLVHIKNLEPQPGGAFASNSTIVDFGNSTNLPKMFSVYPHEQITINNQYFSAGKEGIYHVDLLIEYLVEGSSLNQIERLQLCSIKVVPVKPDENPLSNPIVLAAITVLTFPLILGLVEYFVKRSYVNKDFEFQQRTQHSTWLLQQIHSLVTKYYAPLAKFGKESRTYLITATTTKSEYNMRIAFYYLCLFIKRYVAFEMEVGSNYLFLNQQAESEAIGVMQSIFVSLPFDRRDVNEIAKAVSDDGDNLPNLDYEFFAQWIISDNCVRSRKRAEESLNELALLLDNEAERLSHPDFFLESYETRLSVKDQKVDEEIFWVLRISNKYVKPGEKIIVFGKGFQDERVERYGFKIGERHNTLSHQIINNNRIQISIPQNIEPGSYDLFAEFKIKFYADYDETIGLVVHILTLAEWTNIMQIYNLRDKLNWVNDS